MWARSQLRGAIDHQHRPHFMRRAMPLGTCVQAPPAAAAACTATMPPASVGLAEWSVRESFDGAVVLITGATGFLGSLVLEQLLRCCPGGARGLCILKPYYVIMSPWPKAVDATQPQGQRQQQQQKRQRPSDAAQFAAGGWPMVQIWIRGCVTQGIAAQCPEKY